MAHHTKEWDIPDCPKCGKELEIRCTYKPNTQTKRNPFGEKYSWWECEECGYKKESDENGVH